MATLAVLQIGNAIAGSSVATVGVGNSLLCELALFDADTLEAIAADPASVTATLLAPDLTTPALTVTNPSTGVYGAIATFSQVGTYKVTFQATTGGATFTSVAVGAVVSVAQ